MHLQHVKPEPSNSQLGTAIESNILLLVVDTTVIMLFRS